MTKITGTRSGTRAANDTARAGRVGAWFNACPMPALANNFRVFTQDRLYMSVPRVEPEAISISQICYSANVASGAGGVARFGIYTIINQASPYNVQLGVAYATLLLDAGTVATDGAIGTKTILFPDKVIPAGVWFAIVSVDQVAAPASRRYSQAGLYQISPWGAINPQDSVALTTVSQGGVAGALPATFTPDTLELLPSNGDTGVQFLRSA